MFNVGPLELLIILVIALIVFGPEKLPELIRGVAVAIREFQRYSAELTEVVQHAQGDLTAAMAETTEAVNEAVRDIDQTVAVPGSAPASGAASAEAAPRCAPSEYDTAAVLVDPVDPFPREVVPPTAPEMDTAAALTDGPTVPPTLAYAAPGASGGPPTARRTRRRPTPESAA